MEVQPRRIYRRACVNLQRLSKPSFLALLSDSGRSYFSSMEDEDWSIESFNPLTREACVRIHASSGNCLLSIVLTPVVWS
jgi:hypothetical protein